MASVTLMRQGTRWGQRATFSFEHAMAHRTPLGVIGYQPGFTPQTGSTASPIPPRPPLSQYSVIPYFIDPPMGQRTGAGKWHLNHQQAHDDMLRNIPSRYYWQYYNTVVGPPPTPPLSFQTPPNVSYGLRVGANLIDSSFANERQRKWWTFQNWMEHVNAATAILPPVAPKPAPQWTFQFW
jgi:hypothetical protein